MSAYRGREIRLGVSRTPTPTIISLKSRDRVPVANRRHSLLIGGRAEIEKVSGGGHPPIPLW
jgi:hypothetical protein